MFNSKSLKSAFIMATAAMLMAGCGRAPEEEEDGVTMEFVRIPAGSFYMGSPSSEKERARDEGPVHEVQITKPFYMGRYEVTQAQWKAVMGTTVSQQRNKAGFPSLHLKGEGLEYPIYYVSWEEAVEFCRRLGSRFRLPTEAEWEYACRAGSQTRFYYGDDPDYLQLDLYAWYEGNSDGGTRPVGQKKPNAWGLYDMHGNVSERCSDWYAPVPNSYRNAGSVDPTGPASGFIYRVLRGGDWFSNAGHCRSANRNVGSTPDGRSDFIGFRVVFEGKADNGKKIVDIALATDAAKVAIPQEQKRKIQPAGGLIITGVVRDEAGTPIDDVECGVLPGGARDFRLYAEGKFEVNWQSYNSRERQREYYFVARHMQRNLAAVVEIDEDTDTLDVKLKPGVILTGRIVSTDGKGIRGALITMILRGSNWSSTLPSLIMRTDMEGKFDVRALPLGHKYSLIVRANGYGREQIEVHSDHVLENRVDVGRLVLVTADLSVSGVVVDADDEPVALALVHCSGEGQQSRSTLTGSDGKFTLDGLCKGRIRISASVGGSRKPNLRGHIDTDAGATNVKVVMTESPIPLPKGRACFPAETDVWVNGTVVQISKVAWGQTVDKLGCAGLAAPFGQIEKLEEHVGTFECRSIVLENGNRISVVDAHCFMLDSGRWIAAQDLRNGLKLKTLKQFKFSCTVFRYGMHEYISYRIKTAGCRRS